MRKLSALARAHKRLERQTGKFADSFKNKPSQKEPDPILELTTPATIVPFVLQQQQNYQWQTDLNAFFLAQPADAVLTFRLATVVQVLPSGFVASISSDTLSVAAAQPFSGSVAINVACTAQYLGQTAEALVAFSFTYQNPQVTIERVNNSPYGHVLAAPNWIWTIDLSTWVNYTPAFATLSYEIRTQPTSIFLQARLSGSNLTFENLTSGWGGHNLQVIVRITASNLDQSDYVDYVFSIGSTRLPLTQTPAPQPDPEEPTPDPTPTPDPDDPTSDPTDFTPTDVAPFLRATASAGDIRGTLTEAQPSNRFVSSLPVASYFQITTNLPQTPLVQYTLEEEEAPLDATVFGGFLYITSDTAFNGTRRVTLKLTAALGVLTATATKTWIINSPTAATPPAITLTNTSEDIVLSPDNNWFDRTFLIQRTGFSVTPVDADVAWTVISAHNATTHPRASIIGRIPQLRISSTSEGDWTGRRQVIVQVSANNDGRTVSRLIYFNVTYDKLTMRLRGAPPTYTIIPDDDYIINAAGYVRVNTGTTDIPTYTTSVRWTQGGQGLAIARLQGSQIFINPRGARELTNHTLQITLSASYQGELETETFSLPVFVDAIPPDVIITFDATVWKTEQERAADRDVAPWIIIGVGTVVAFLGSLATGGAGIPFLITVFVHTGALLTYGLVLRDVYAEVTLQEFEDRQLVTFLTQGATQATVNLTGQERDKIFTVTPNQAVVRYRFIQELTTVGATNEISLFITAPDGGNVAYNPPSLGNIHPTQNLVEGSSLTMQCLGQYGPRVSSMPPALVEAWLALSEYLGTNFSIGTAGVEIIATNLTKQDTDFFQLTGIINKPPSPETVIIRSLSNISITIAEQQEVIINPSDYITVSSSGESPTYIPISRVFTSGGTGVSIREEDGEFILSAPFASAGSSHEVFLVYNAKVYDTKVSFTLDLPISVI